MKIKIPLLLPALFTLSIYSQQIPLDFSTNDDTFDYFDGSGFSFRPDVQDGANQVGQFFNDGSNPYQGFFINLAQPVVLDTDNKVFSLRFYSFDPNDHTILLKLEDSNNTDVQVQASFSVPSEPSDWIDVFFDFSNAQDSSDGSSVNASGSYGRLTIFVDEGTNTPGTYLIDDITNGDTPSPPNNPNDIDVVYDVLVWSDDFNGTNGPIDTNKWFHQTQIPSDGNWYNGEQQHYTDRTENSFIEDGNLNIKAIFEGRIANGQGYSDQGYTKEYTSARLNSKFAFTYGRVDVRAKLPFGDGTWPAIWTLGKNISEAGAYWQTQGFGTTSWPACGEIDIMEHGLHSLNEVSVALHTPSSSGATVNTDTQLLSDVANNFHIYSINWSPDKIVFLIDDVAFYTYNPSVKNSFTWPFDDEQYLLLNVAMGGIAGTIDPNFSESNMVIDYVKVYQNSSLTAEEKNANLFKVFPNPANDLITVSSLQKIDRLRLYNTLGQLVKENFNSTTIKVSTIDPGIYILKIESGVSIETKKILVN